MSHPARSNSVVSSWLVAGSAHCGDLRTLPYKTPTMPSDSDLDPFSQAMWMEPLRDFNGIPAVQTWPRHCPYDYRVADVDFFDYP